jgi:hypothetical protein
MAALAAKADGEGLNNWSELSGPYPWSNIPGIVTAMTKKAAISSEILLRYL